VPSGKYDAIETVALMPTVATENVVHLEWHFNEASNEIMPKMYRLEPGGKRTEMTQDPDGGYSDRSIDLQQAESGSALSLWE
jgi:hypothetical protein